jgi:hypothetical protein
MAGVRYARAHRFIRFFLYGQQIKGEDMKIPSLIIVLITATAVAALGQEGVGQEIKRGAKKTGEAIKDGLKTVGEKTKEAAETVAEKTKEAWRKTKAYASEDRVTYRKGARQKLSELKSEITELKSRRSEAADPEAFDKQLDTLSQQQATAEDQLAKVKSTTGTDDYPEARKQFDTTIDAMEDGIAQARKQLRG